MRYRSTGLAMLTCFAACGSPPTAEHAISNGGGTETPAEPGESPPATPAPEPSQPSPAVVEAPAAQAPEVAESGVEDDAAGGEPEDGDDGDPPGNTVEETRTTEVIQRVVLNNRQSVRDCYDLERSKEPSLSGTLTIFFEIDPKGNVKKAELNEARSTLKQPALVACAIRAVQRLKFPPSSRGFESEINYPFDLRP